MVYRPTQTTSKPPRPPKGGSSADKEGRTMTREEAIALVREVSNYMATRPEIDEAIDMAIEALQTDIVRCKDCKWYENACTFFAADPFERAPMEKNDFCSYGERRIENLTVKIIKRTAKTRW